MYYNIIFVIIFIPLCGGKDNKRFLKVKKKKKTKIFHFFFVMGRFYRIYLCKQCELILCIGLKITKSVLCSCSNPPTFHILLKPAKNNNKKFYTNKSTSRKTNNSVPPCIAFWLLLIPNTLKIYCGNKVLPTPWRSINSIDFSIQSLC